MAKRSCVRCGSSGFFIRLSSEGICTKCIEHEKQKEFDDALSYINSLSGLVAIATEHTTVLPGRGAKSIRVQKEACKNALQILDDWKSFRRFNDAFSRTTQACSDRDEEWRVHPLFRNRLITPLNGVDFDKWFSELKKELDDIYTKCILAEFRAYDYSKSFHVVGVTFCNGKKSRQSILRKLGKGFGEGYDVIRLERYLYEGEDAIAVYVQGEQAGNISREDLPWLLEHWCEYAFVSNWEVVGDYETKGLYITVCFRHT